MNESRRIRHLLALAFWSLAGGYLLLRLVFGAALVGRAADHAGMVFGMPQAYSSMDSAEALRTVRRSTWWGHNGYRQYGPLYFRVAWTLEKLDPAVGRGSPWRWGQANDLHHHLAMTLLNWACMFGLCAAIAWPLCRNPRERIAAVLLLHTALLYGDIWCWGIFAAKLEYFICLLAAVMALWVWRLFPSSGRAWKPLLFASVFFGLVLATKLVGLVYLLCLPLAFLPPLRLRNADRAAMPAWKRLLDAWPIHQRILPGLAFLLLAFAVYLAVGWPQNADFDWLTPYMKVMVKSNAAPVGTMPDMEWGRRLAEQGIPIGLAVTFLAVLSPAAADGERRRPWDVFRAALFVFLPLHHIFGTRVASPSEHYLMPFIASGLVMWSGIARGLWPAAWRPGGRWRAALPWAIVALAILLPLALPTRWGPYTAKLFEEKSLVAERYRIVTSLQREHPKVFVDPFVPHNPNLGRVFWTYRANDGLFVEQGPTVLVLWPTYYKDYLAERHNFFLLSFHSHTRHASAEFYQRFQGGVSEITDPLGRRWTREDILGLEIWTLRNAGEGP